MSDDEFFQSSYHAEQEGDPSFQYQSVGDENRPVVIGDSAEDECRSAAETRFLRAWEREYHDKSPQCGTYRSALEYLHGPKKCTLSTLRLGTRHPVFEGILRFRPVYSYKKGEDPDVVDRSPAPLQGVRVFKVNVQYAHAHDQDPLDPESKCKTRVFYLPCDSKDEHGKEHCSDWLGCTAATYWAAIDVLASRDFSQYSCTGYHHWCSKLYQADRPTTSSRKKMGPLLEFAVRIENHYHPRILDPEVCGCITDVTFDPWYTNVMGDPDICLLTQEPERPDFFGKGFVCPDYGQGDREFYSFADESSSEASFGTPASDPGATHDGASLSSGGTARDAGGNPQS